MTVRDKPARWKTSDGALRAVQVAFDVEETVLDAVRRAAYDSNLSTSDQIRTLLALSTPTRPKRPRLTVSLSAADYEVLAQRYGLSADDRLAIKERVTAELMLVVTHEPPESEGNERRHAVFLRLPGGQWQHHGNPQGERAFTDLLEQYNTRLMSLEARYASAQSAEEMFEVMDRLLPLARAATNLRDALQSAREMVKEDKLLIDLRDRAVDVARGLEQLLANARASLDYRIARHAEEQTQAAMNGIRAQNKLNVIAALTFPLMTVATVFGMNLHSGLETLPGWAFWGVFGGGVVLGLMVRGWVQPSTPLPTRPARPAKGKNALQGKPKGPGLR